MKLVQTIVAFLLAVAASYVVAIMFFTQQVIASRAAIGAIYTPEQQFATFVDNFFGLAPTLGVGMEPAFGDVWAIALLLGFLVAAGLKRILTPLAPVAYPIGGAAAVYAAIFLIENTAGSGGVGALEGARGALGMGLQSFAGFIGGVVFAMMRGRAV